MTRLDHNRAKAQLAAKAGAHVERGQGVRSSGATTPRRSSRTWRTRPSPDTPALSRVPQSWYREEFIPTVQQRGAAIIKARGASSAASAASAAIDHVRDWALGTPATTGSAWPLRPTAATGSPKASCTRIPVRCAPRRVPDRAGARDRRLRARQARRHRRRSCARSAPESPTCSERRTRPRLRTRWARQEEQRW